ncbi:hypothetical protein J6590_062574 [Homalodisca vitripennis]|nr:hypothetical protein J6590_062574 [Homalodisca vitripennis]
MASAGAAPSSQVVGEEILTQNDPRFRVKPYQQMVASCTGAVLTSFIITPLDVVKIRLQAQQMALSSKKCFIFCNGLMDHICPCLEGDQWYRRHSPFTGTWIFSPFFSVLLEGVIAIKTLKMTNATDFSAHQHQKKFDHISPYRKRANLHSVQDICRLQTVTLVHKVLVTGEPSYLRRKLVARATLRERHTRQDDKLQLPRVRLEATKRSFSYFGPQEYNALPPDALIKIARNEGITSLWSGLSPTLILAIPSTVVYFTTYEQLRTRLNDYFKDPETNKQPIWVPMVSGVTARFSAATCVSPMELIRTKMQSKKLSYGDALSVVKGLVRLHGYRGLWKGLTPTLFRDMPFSGIYWVCYEYLKSYFYPEEKVPFWFSFLAGSASGTLAAFVTTPFDVVKTHQQLDITSQIYQDEQMQKKPKKSVLHWFRKIYADGGVRGLYTGLTPRLAKTAPACAIMVSTFEYGKNFFERYNMNEYKRQNMADA